MAKFIVKKGKTFFWSSPPKIEQCREYAEGEIVDLPGVKGKPPSIGDNLRPLTAAELQLTPSVLKERELLEPEKTLSEDDEAEQAAA